MSSSVQLYLIELPLDLHRCHSKSVILKIIIKHTTAGSTVQTIVYTGGQKETPPQCQGWTQEHTTTLHVKGDQRIIQDVP